MKKTKIIATLGPSTDKEGVLRGILEAGVDVVRFNMSHGDYAEHAGRMAQVKALREELGLPIAALLDTKGPEIRTGNFAEPVVLEEGQKFTLYTNDHPGDKDGCYITYAGLPRDVSIGQRILIDDGLVGMVVDSITDNEIRCTVQNGGKVSSHKGINCPETHFSMPYLSDKDRDDLSFGKEQGFDYIAASFVRCADDVRCLRYELDRIGWKSVKVISKIENAEGVANMDEIIALSDGIMVARGDMGVEIALEEIPVVQKQLIKKTVSVGKVVVTATQMLDSMIYNPRPTRAEATDVANAIYDGTTAIMLSGETAAGKYPVETVRTMASIAKRTESDIDYLKRFHNMQNIGDRTTTTAISHATVMTAQEIGAAAIVTLTESGFTARMVSRFMPRCLIIATTPNEGVCRQMNLLWGVMPMLVPEKNNTDELFAAAVEAAVKHDAIKRGDRLVLTAGLPLGSSGSTNMIKVQDV